MTETAERKTVKGWKMPTLDVGEWVNWHPGGFNKERSLPALVTQVNAESICVAAFENNLVGHHVMDGVRHHEDPNVKDFDRIERGTWTYSRDQILEKALFDRIEALEKMVAELRAKK